MSAQNFSQIDLDSPGYEFLRSHRSMNSLYLKLVALNYQDDFCLIYKCPQLHKYYFSSPSEKPSEQVFIFMCLCAWLIKDKCQMNFDLAPEEYQDVDTTIGIIFEAIKLLLLLDDEPDQKNVANVINFAPARLKRGFGPEVIWTVSVLADRALELAIETSPGLGRAQITYHDRPVDNARGTLSSITIGQPIVGGGLTTRPLGSYLIDDSNLLIAEDQSKRTEQNDPEPISEVIDESEQWLQQVERESTALQAASGKLNIGIASLSPTSIHWRQHMQATNVAGNAIQDFLNQSKSLLEMIALRADKQLQIISEREKYLRTNLKRHIDEFMVVWRDYDKQYKRNNKLLEQVNLKTDLFGSHNNRLKNIGAQIVSRTKELHDGTKLKELDGMVEALKAESVDLDVKVNLLLTVYARKQDHLRDQRLS